MCNELIDGVDTNKPQTLFDTYKPRIEEFGLKDYYDFVVNRENGDGKYLTQFESADIRAKWNNKINEAIKKLESKQKVEYQVWKESPTYKDYQKQIERLQKLRLS